MRQWDSRTKTSIRVCAAASISAGVCRSGRLSLLTRASAGFAPIFLCARKAISSASLSISWSKSINPTPFLPYCGSHCHANGLRENVGALLGVENLSDGLPQRFSGNADGGKNDSGVKSRGLRRLEVVTQSSVLGAYQMRLRLNDGGQQFGFVPRHRAVPACELRDEAGRYIEAFGNRCLGKLKFGESCSDSSPFRGFGIGWPRHIAMLFD